MFKLTSTQEKLVVERLDSISDMTLHERYDQMLDDVYGEVVVVGNLYYASTLLEKADPIAYRCGFADWIDSELDENLIEIDGDYYDFKEVQDLIESEDEV